MANLKIKPLQDYYVELNSKKEDGAMIIIIGISWLCLFRPTSQEGLKVKSFIML